MITRQSGNEIIGSMFNEFGVSVLSFIYDRNKNKLKLRDVMGMLDKWYIKRVLKSDLTLCLHLLCDTPYGKRSNKYVVTHDSESISIRNAARNITYSFHTLNTDS